jgi:hypothetical protein
MLLRTSLPLLHPALSHMPLQTSHASCLQDKMQALVRTMHAAAAPARAARCKHICGRNKGSKEKDPRRALLSNECSRDATLHTRNVRQLMTLLSCQALLRFESKQPSPNPAAPRPFLQTSKQLRH